MFYILALLIGALSLCAFGVLALIRACYCACARQGQCDNPVGKYWLLGIVSQLASLGGCALALHSHLGSLAWFLMITGCLGGTYLMNPLKLRLQARLRVSSIARKRVKETARGNRPSYRPGVKAVNAP